MAPVRSGSSHLKAAHGATRVPLPSVTRAEAKSDGFQGGGATHCSGRAAASGRVADWIAESTLNMAATEGFADGALVSVRVSEDMGMESDFVLWAREYVPIRHIEAGIASQRPRSPDGNDETATA